MTDNDNIQLPPFLRTIEDLETEDLDDFDLKKYALAEHLEVDPDDITSGYTDDDFTVYARTERAGSSPAHYKQLAKDLRQILSENNRLENTYQEVVDQFKTEYDHFIYSKLIKTEELTDSDRRDGAKISEETRRHFMRERYTLNKYAYDQLKGLIPDSPMHRLINGLYFVICGPAGSHENGSTWHIYASRAAFNNEDLKDKRPIHAMNSGEYKVLTEDQVDQEVKEYIRESIWAFSPDFLAGETGIDSEVFERLSEGCESSNDAILSIIEGSCGLDNLVDSAISCDGRGHFLSSFDGEETEITGLDGEDLLIYRTH